MSCLDALVGMDESAKSLYKSKLRKPRSRLRRLTARFPLQNGVLAGGPRAACCLTTRTSPVQENSFSATRENLADMVRPRVVKGR